MDDFRTYPKGNTRQLIDYNRFASLTGEKWLFCLDRGVIELAKYLLNSRGLYVTTYYTELLDNGYTVPNTDQFELIENAIAEANLDMSGCTDIVAELALIRGALTAMAQGAGAGCGDCGGGSRGAGASESAPSDFTDTGENFPPSFDDREEFNAHKCNQAYDIINALQADLQGLAGIEYTVSGNIPEIVGILLGVLVTPIPYDDIVYLVALLLFTIIEYTFLVEFSSVVFDNRDNLACILYNSEDAGQAQVDFEAELDSLVDGEAYPDAAKDFVKDVVHHLVTFDAINLLYSDVPTISSGNTCSGCGTEDTFFIDTIGGEFAGVLIAGDMVTAGNIESAPIDLFGGERQVIQLQSTGEPQDNYFRIDNVLSDSGAATYTMDVFDDSNTLIFTTTVSDLSDLELYESDACKAVQIRDSTGFTSTMVISFSFSTEPF